MKKVFDIETESRSQFLDITNTVQAFVKDCKVESGTCAIFIPHTTAAVTINENADPSVKSDLTRKLNELIPQQDNYQHLEGNSDSHLKSSLFGPSLTVIIDQGKLVLGTWQGIMFCEFDGPRHRRFIVKVQPD